MYNAVYVLLPIMLSISVFLLLAGWKGVRGGLSQLIYHIKYQPSSTFSLPFFFIPLFSHLSLLSRSFPHSFSSPPAIYVFPSHLSFLVFLPLLFLSAFPYSPIPSHFSPSGLKHFSEGSHPSQFFFLTNDICLCTPAPASPSRP